MKIISILYLYILLLLIIIGKTRKNIGDLQQIEYFFMLIKDQFNFL